MLTRLTLAALALGLAIAGPTANSTHTFHQLNGRGWLTLSPEARAAYLDGLNDGLATSYGRAMGTSCETHESRILADYATPGITTGEVGRFLGELYAKPENRNVAVSDAVEILVGELRNVPREEIEKRLADHRKVAATAPERAPR